MRIPLFKNPLATSPPPHKVRVLSLSVADNAKGIWHESAPSPARVAAPFFNNLDSGTWHPDNQAGNPTATHGTFSALHHN